MMAIAVIEGLAHLLQLTLLQQMAYISRASTGAPFLFTSGCGHAPSEHGAATSPAYFGTLADAAPAVQLEAASKGKQRKAAQAELERAEARLAKYQHRISTGQHGDGLPKVNATLKPLTSQILHSCLHLLCSTSSMLYSEVC